jgi:DNA-binding transcriptional LysR family regulator
MWGTLAHYAARDSAVDVAVRAGALRDSSLVARSLGTVKSYLVATPAFLRRHGAPKSPDEIARFDCVVFGPDRAGWMLTREGKTTTVNVKARLLVNDFEFLEEAARSGLGITMLPLFRCVEELRNKTLRRVLPEWCTSEFPLHALYPSTRHLSPTVKAFLDHLREAMTPPPWERGPML